MALYSFSFIIPKQTPKDKPVEKIVKVGSGLIKKIQIRIPPTHYGLAKLRIYAQEALILPENPEEWVYGHNEIIEDELMLLILRPQYEFRLVGYNESMFRDLGFIVRFVVVPLTTFKTLPIARTEEELVRLLTE